ncbi:MAG: antibiotic biosynthesis monooxygenase [Cyanobacteria bacterium Co-bin8]|nr:antibiotic biosynthesis monooxygenase [Cyanobacteria bacterium Co-bin8]
MPSSIRTITRVIAKPDCGAVVKSLLQSLVFPSREEPGCLGYELWQGLHGSEFVTIGDWQDEVALVAHLRSAHIYEFSTEVVEYLAHPPDVQWYGQVEA